MLQEEDVDATFFLVGAHAIAYPEIVARMAASPNVELGSHTGDHVDLTKEHSSSVSEQVDGNARLLAQLAGTPISLFRPPWGRRDRRVDAIARSAGQSLILYSLDSKDWQHESVARTVQRVAERAVDGDIVLLHDTLPSTVEATRPLVRALKERGFHLVTVTGLLGATIPGRRYAGRIDPRTRILRRLELELNAWRTRVGRLTRMLSRGSDRRSREHGD